MIDNYIDADILKLFTKNQNVKIIFYTQKTTKNFHDRFVIIDDKIYHFGVSLKDLGKKIFASSKLDITAKMIIGEL